jgi:colanic acid biosynthesis glycosyl transferase WcaI
MKKKLLFLSYNSPPELTGIGKYNGELLEWFSQNHFDVYFLTTFPYYPEWKVSPAYQGKFTMLENIYNSVRMRRVWSYVPGNVNTITRILKAISYLILSNVVLLYKRMKGYYPDYIFIVNPPFLLGFGIDWIFPKAKVINHLQDLELDAALELSLIPNFMSKILINAENYILNKADMITTISEGMRLKVESKNIKPKVELFPNWADVSEIYPTESFYLYEKFTIPRTKKTIVYSGNIGRKQGLGRIAEIVETVTEIRKDVVFIVLGEGGYKKNLIEKCSRIDPKYLIIDNLVPKNELNNMLNSSFIQLVLQKHEGSDSFLPSKFLNIIAAGVPSIVTTLPNTTLFNMITNNSIAIAVEDSAQAVAKGILDLLDDEDKITELRRNTVVYAKKYLDKNNVISAFQAKLNSL